jgi:hypothetical protein
MDKAGNHWVASVPYQIRVQFPDLVVYSIPEHNWVMKQEGCTVFSRDEWECETTTYTTGFRGGKWFHVPELENRKIVSSWEHNFRRCESEIKSKGLKGVWHCIGDWN